MLWENGTPRFWRYLALSVIFASGITVAFDILRKTVFLGASWNFDYPYWHFVYEPLVVGLLVLILTGTVVAVPRLFELSRRWFILTLYALTTVSFLAALFSLPLEATSAFDVRFRGLFDAAVMMVERGPLETLSSYHSLPGSIPEHPEYMVTDPDSRTLHESTADRISAVVAAADSLPFNESIASCIDLIVVQKHGPASLFLVAPFLLLFGTTTEVATVGGIVLVSLVPVVGYFSFDLYFDELPSRTGALLLGFAPALFIFTRQGSPVAYDAFTGLYVAIGVYFLLRALTHGGFMSFALGGISLSLAAMTKLTGSFVFASVLLLTGYYWWNQRLSSRQAGVLYTAYAALPLGLFLAGYNFVCQYVFTVLKVVGVGGGNGGRTGANANLQSDLIATITPIYNTRWIGIVLLLFVVVFLINLFRQRKLNEKDVVAISLLVGAGPFLIYPFLSTGTLSRHLLAFVVPIGFAAVRGYDIMTDHGVDSVRIAQLGLAVTMASFLVNI